MKALTIAIASAVAGVLLYAAPALANPSCTACEPDPSSTTGGSQRCCEEFDPLVGEPICGTSPGIGGGCTHPDPADPFTLGCLELGGEAHIQLDNENSTPGTGSCPDGSYVPGCDACGCAFTQECDPAS